MAVGAVQNGKEGLVGESSAGCGDEAALATQSPSAALAAASSPANFAKLEQDKLQRLEDRILEKSLLTVYDSLHWEDIDAGAVDPPQAWIDEVGLEAAKKRLRVAQAAWMNAKEAPVALNMARAISMGITKVRAARQVGTPTLNINFVSFQQPVLDVIDVEGE